jgi:hypothetical protein
LAGSTVYYQVLITNDTTPTATALDPAMLVTSLTDNPALTFSYQSGDTNGNHLIDLGETWTYTVSTRPWMGCSQAAMVKPCSWTPRQ